MFLWCLLSVRPYCKHFLINSLNLHNNPMKYCSVNPDSCFSCFVMQVSELSFDCPGGFHFKEASTSKMTISNKHIASHRTR